MLRVRERVALQGQTATVDLGKDGSSPGNCRTVKVDILESCHGIDLPLHDMLAACIPRDAFGLLRFATLWQGQSCGS